MMYWFGSEVGVWGYVLMTFSMLLFWGAVITAIVVLARSPRPPASPQQPPAPTKAQSTLAERFARGEIDENGYQNGLEVLGRRPSA